MNWVVVEEAYLDYLRKIDNRIPFSNYGPDKLKPFFGYLFEVENDIVYLAQVSHPQDKHLLKKEDYSFKKLLHPKSNQLIAVINLNYMFPIKKRDAVNLEYKNIQQYRNFNSPVEMSKYIDLLSLELKIINSMNICDSAKKLYKIKNSYPESRISKVCIDFKKLEKFVDGYKK